MNEIYVKVENLFKEDEIKHFNNADTACEYASKQSRVWGVNYCRVFIGGFLQYSYDCGIRI